MIDEKGPLILVFVVLGVICIFLSYLVTSGSAAISFAIVVLVCISLITFVNVDFGLAILLISMLFSPEIKFGETSARAATLRFEDLMLLTVFFVWLAKVAIYKEITLLKKTALNMPIIAYSLICIVSTLKGLLTGNIEFKSSMMFLLKYIEYFFLYFMVVNHIKTEKQIKGFLVVILLVGFLTALFGYKYIGVRAVAGPVHRAVGESRATIAGYFVFIMALSFGIMLYVKSFYMKFLLFLLNCVIITPFLFTFSRGGYTGLVGMYLIMLFLAKQKRLMLAVFLAFLVIIGIKFVPQKVVDRITYTFTMGGKTYSILGQEFNLEWATAARISSYGRVPKWLDKHPFIGAGVTGVGIVDAQYPRVIGEVGLIGFFIFLWLLLKVFLECYSAFRVINTPYLKGMAIGFIAGFFGILIQGIGANTFIIVRIMELFWFTVAMLVILKERATA